MKKTIGYGMLFFVFFSISAPRAQTLSGPFDEHRLDADVGQPTGHGAPTKQLAAPRRGIFCGLIGDLNSLSICVDGAWMSQDEFSLRAGAKMVLATNMAVKLSTGEVIEIGNMLPKWKMSWKKGAVK